MATAKARKPKGPPQAILVLREKDGEVIPFQATAYATLNGAMKNSYGHVDMLAEVRPGFWTARSSHVDYDLPKPEPITLYFVDVFSFAESVVAPEIAHITVHRR